MDPATLIGMVIAFVAIFVAMILEGGNPMSIFLPAPLDPRLRRHLGVGIAGGARIKDVVAALKTPCPRRSRPRRRTRPAPSTTIVELAERARREGLLALEDAARDIDDPFLRSGLQTAVDGTDPDDLRDDPRGPRSTTKRSRDKAAAKFFADMGGYAPTIGIIGTVIALVHVLENLAKPEELGPPDRRRVRRDAVGRLLAPTSCGCRSASRIKRISEPRGRADGGRARGRRWPSRPAPTRASSASSCAACSRRPTRGRGEGQGRRHERRHGAPRRRAAEHEEEEHENHERWLVSYADMITVLMALFIVLFAISQVDQEKFVALQDSLAAGFGATSVAVLDGGTGLLDAPDEPAAGPGTLAWSTPTPDPGDAGRSRRRRR